MKKTHPIQRLLCGALCFGLSLVVPVWSAPQDNWTLERSFGRGNGLKFVFGDSFTSTIGVLPSGNLLIGTESAVFCYSPEGASQTISVPFAFSPGRAVVLGQDVLYASGSAIYRWNSLQTSPSTVLEDNPLGQDFERVGNINSFAISRQTFSGPGGGPCLHLYLRDGTYRRISVWALPLDGSPAQALFVFGSEGSANGQFSASGQTMAGPNGLLYVQDNYRTQVFQDTGTDLVWLKNITFYFGDMLDLGAPGGALWWLFQITPDGLLFYSGWFMDPSVVPLGREGTTKPGDVSLGFLKHLAKAGEIDGAVAFSADGNFAYALNRDSGQVDVYRRGFRTFGAATPNRVPVPVIEKTAFHANTGKIEAEFKILDPDDATVRVGALMVPEGREAVAEMIPVIPAGADLLASNAVSLATNLPANTKHRLVWTPPAGFTSGRYRLKLLARDSRAGLVDFHFVQLPAETNPPASGPERQVSRSPLGEEALFQAARWLLAKGSNQITVTNGYVFATPTGLTAYEANRPASGGLPIEESDPLIATDPESGKNLLTPQGRDFFLDLLGVKRADLDTENRVRGRPAGYPVTGGGTDNSKTNIVQVLRLPGTNGGSLLLGRDGSVLADGVLVMSGGGSLGAISNCIRMSAGNYGTNGAGDRPLTELFFVKRDFSLETWTITNRVVSNGVTRYDIRPGGSFNTNTDIQSVAGASIDSPGNYARIALRRDGTVSVRLEGNNPSYFGQGDLENLLAPAMGKIFQVAVSASTVSAIRSPIFSLAVAGSISQFGSGYSDPTATNRIVALAAGDHHHAYLAENGKVWAMGGWVQIVENGVERDYQAAEIAAWKNYTMLKTKSGDLWRLEHTYNLESTTQVFVQQATASRPNIVPTVFNLGGFGDWTGVFNEPLGTRAGMDLVAEPSPPRMGTLPQAINYRGYDSYGGGADPTQPELFWVVPR